MRHNKNLTLSEVPLQLQQSNRCQATSGVTEIIIKKPKKDICKDIESNFRPVTGF